MSEPKTITVVLFTGDPDDEAGQKAVFTVTAKTVLFGARSCTLFDADDGSVAVINWSDPIKARKL